MEKPTLPSYPSEAGVLAGVTAEIMKLMFPTEIANIQQKLEEQELAAIMSGSATRADVAAGEALGRQIASVFAARAKTDKAGAAVGTPDHWSSTCNKHSRHVAKQPGKALNYRNARLCCLCLVM